MEDDPLGSFSQVSNKILHVKDVRAYIHYKFESIGESDIHKYLDLVYNNDQSWKIGFEHVNELNIIKHMFYMEFGNHRWNRIILSIIHESMF